MTNRPVIAFHKVSKHFMLAHQKTLKEMVHAFFTHRKTLERVKALTEITFSIPQGQSVGIIGRNGAGKSTLLKLIAGVTSPTAGTIEINEPVYPLIELGAGFHPELTGRENIFLNGVILGMSEKEVKEQYESIVEFSELRNFMDVPVKYYSSGMYARLAFSVATCKIPQILLVDEILAVGDMKFQEKCVKRMQHFKNQGTSMIIVAHGGPIMERFCERVLYLKSGQLVFDGSFKKALAAYKAEK